MPGTIYRPIFRYNYAWKGLIIACKKLIVDNSGDIYLNYCTGHIAWDNLVSGWFNHAKPHVDLLLVFLFAKTEGMYPETPKTYTSTSEVVQFLGISNTPPRHVRTQSTDAVPPSLLFNSKLFGCLDARAPCQQPVTTSPCGCHGREPVEYGCSVAQ